MKWNYEGAERGNCSHIPSVVILNNDTAFFIFLQMYIIQIFLDYQQSVSVTAQRPRQMIPGRKWIWEACVLGVVQ